MHNYKTSTSIFTQFCADILSLEIHDIVQTRML